MLAALLLSSIATATAHAPTADLTNYYGNTIVCKDSKGSVTKVRIGKDGKFTVNRGNGDIRGIYTISGNSACFTEKNPAPPAGTKPFCQAGMRNKVGDSWKMTDPKGATTECVLKKGPA